MIEIALPAHEELLAAFYRDLYLPAFAHQREPLDAWQRRLRDPAAAEYALRVFVEGDALLGPDRRLDGGVVCEVYPRSRCGLLTYLVVAPAARRRGLGRALLDRARGALGDVALVLGEISDPRRHAGDDAAWRRLEQFQRWGARVLDVPYVQPDLGFGRDPDLALVAFDPPTPVPAAPLAAFLREFYRVAEGGPPPPPLAAIPDPVPVVEVRRG